MSTGFPRLYPKVTRLVKPDAMGIGPMASAPSGVTVHYTADGDVDRTIRSLMVKGYGYHLLIDRDGTVTQTAYFDLCVAHAGKAVWNKLSPNRHHIAIALMSWGRLDDQSKAWNGRPIENAIERDGKLWDAATPAQEVTLFDILSWCKSEGIVPENICGHDECAVPPGRKSDPGGVLSMTMTELRSKVKNG